MLRDWGTGLELSLYHQAIVHLLGGSEQVSRQLSMQSGGTFLGYQRFHLVDDYAVFRLTAFEEIPDKYHEPLIKLITPSPLQTIHWINIALEEVTFRSLHR